MGWYATCKYCGEEGKYGLSCGCYEKESKKTAEKMEGYRIVSNFIGRGDFFQELSKNGKKMYIRINLEAVPEQIVQTLVEINREEFEKSKREMVE